MPSAPWDERARRAWDRALFGADLAIGVVLVALAGIGAWLLAIGGIGKWVVYADTRTGNASETSGAARPDESGAAGEAGRAAGAPFTSGALVPRLPATYPFDDLPRAIDGNLSCPTIELTEFAGNEIRLVPPARVALPFRERLVELEGVVREVSQQFYGRAPSALLVAASYDCRPITGNRRRISEHALGNAIDITAIRFDADAESGAPAFEARVDEHWNARGDDEVERRAHFLRALTRALIARDVFRTLLGPAHPDHQDHFHFDMAPQRYVDL